MRPHVGPIASSDTFYDPDPERHKRWGERGVLAVEMEAAVLFTIGGLRNVQTACLLTVSDLVHGETFDRISDDELAAGVERMCRLAIAAAVDYQVTAVMIVNPASDSGAHRPALARDRRAGRGSRARRRRRASPPRPGTPPSSPARPFGTGPS